MIERIDPKQSKAEIVAAIRKHLEGQGFTIAAQDLTRPWGAFLRIVNAQADKFVAEYFDSTPMPGHARSGERSPKILIVAPHQRLSWQYHHHRGELWRVASGKVGVFFSVTDAQPLTMRVLELGDTVELPKGMRHRLVGLDEWGAVAEIWMHSDADKPSDESDIVRLQDDYARTSPL